MNQVWLLGRHPRTLRVMAAFLIYEHSDRLRAEAVLENAEADQAELVAILRTQYPVALVSTQMVLAGCTLQLN